MAGEQIIIVDENDDIIGYKDRSALTKDDIYRVSDLWVRNSRGELLLAQRSFSKKRSPGLWTNAVSGTNDKGETYESNMIKEAEEELGIKGIKFRKSKKIRYGGRHNFFCQGFTVLIDRKAEDFRLQKDEVEQVKWYRKEELEKELKENPEKFHESVRTYLDFLEDLKG